MLDAMTYLCLKLLSAPLKSYNKSYIVMGTHPTMQQKSFSGLPVVTAIEQISSGFKQHFKGYWFTE